MITKIKVSNFKSFNELEIDLQNYNVLIGSNASGKSNFVQIFKFLHDIIEYDLSNAISLQGGFKYLSNMKLGSSKNFSIEINSNNELNFILDDGEEDENDPIGIGIYNTNYKFSLKILGEKLDFKVIEEILEFKINNYLLKKVLKTEKIMNKLTKPKNPILQYRDKEKCGESIIKIIRNGKKVKVNISEGSPLCEDDIFSGRTNKAIKLEDKRLLIEEPLSIFTFHVRNILRHILAYDFDPKLCKKSSLITGKSDLEENGENLSIVLNNVLNNKEDEDKLLNLLNELLPFVEKIKVDEFVDRSLIFNLKEKHSPEFLPALLLSDGTINVTALIVALYFQNLNNDSLSIFEEPERNLHPYLISGTVDMMKDISKKKQIITTTHNPELIKYAGLENILFISRDENDYSQIIKPKEKGKIQAFLQNQIGIEELYVRNLIGL